MEAENLSKELKFESSKTETHTTEHYIFHFLPGSLAEKDIQSIAQIQEEAFSEISDTLKISYPQQIHYYFTDSPSEIGSTLWEEGTLCNGVAICGCNKIYAVYNETTKCIGAHEDAHLISFLLGFPKSDFLVEGLAMFFDKTWWGISNAEWASYFKDKYADITIQKLLSNQLFAEYECVITYPIAGAFTGFLITTYGIDHYIRLYTHKNPDPEECFQSVFNLSLLEVETSFWSAMHDIGFDANVLEQLLEAEGY